MKRWQVDGTLLLVVMLWGSTFFVVHDATKLWNPVAFVALRFGLAALALLPWGLRSVRRWERADWRVGIILGLLLYAGYISQTIGISLTTASRSGFITGLNVVLVPLLGALLWRSNVRRQVWLGVALAVAGLFVLALDPGAGNGNASLLGDGLVFGCAIMFAGHILAVGHLAGGRSLVAINVVQIGTVALLATLTSLVFEDVAAPSAAVWWAAIYLGVVCTALLLVIQVVAQRYASPTHTAMIFVLEPIFAAGFAAMFGGERLSLLLVWGGLLMMSGIVLAELPPLRRKRIKQST